MFRPKMLIIAASLAVAGAANAALPASNPFAAASTLPLNYPAFDKFKNEDYGPAYDEGMNGLDVVWFDNTGFGGAPVAHTLGTSSQTASVVGTWSR